MAGPTGSFTRTNVLAGPGELWYGKYGTVSIPPATDVDVAVNASTTASAGWTNAGGTDDGLNVTVNQSFFMKVVDQSPDAVGAVLNERQVQVQTNLAEATLENLALAMNTDVADVTSGSGYKQLDLKIGLTAMMELDEFVILVDGWAPGTSKRRRVVLRRVLSVENIESAYQKEGLVLWPVTFQALYIDSSTSPVSWVDET